MMSIIATTDFLWLPVIMHFLAVTWQTCAVEVNGAGASFPFDVYSAWIPAYKAHRRQFRHVEMKYESIGSGGGKARIKGTTGPPVAYAGSDSLLNEEEYRAHPDLQMMPSMAGAIVMAYNIPGINKLHLSMTHIAAIYNGTIRHWNHTVLLELNPFLAQLGQEIRVAARRDKSGTTELFTAALSAADENWRNSYGTFSHGLRADDTPYQWESSVVTLYGETNRGVSGMVMSTRYSIGYLVLSDAVTTKLNYATLLNAAGNLVNATVESVQSTMDDFATSFTPRITRSLGNPQGSRSYPISGYTYLILRMTSMTDCLQATELVRYIEWFYTSRIARADCENQYMVPLSVAVYQTVLDEVVRRVTCRGQNVHSLVMDDRHREQLSLETWRTPVYIACPVIAVLVIILILYLVRDQIRTNRALLRDEWRILPKDVLFASSSADGSNPGSHTSIAKSRSKVHPSMSSVDTTLSSLTAGKAMEGRRVGRYRTHRVLLTELPILTGSVTLSMKRGILRLRDTVTHDHLTRFYGLYLDSSATGPYCTVGQFCANGDLQNMLHSTRYTMDNNFKFSLCISVAKGLHYLHSHRLVHGSLTSTKIYLDDAWALRVGGWEVNSLASFQKKCGVSVDMEVADWTREEFWTAPEVLSQKSLPSHASDIYSFAIVMQEVFSRDMPYADQSEQLSPSETLTKVVCESLRPFFTPDTPLEAREVMLAGWEMDPLARPSAHFMLTALKKACPKTRSLVDCMLDSLLHYVDQVEQTQHAVSGGGLHTEKADSQYSDGGTGHKGLTSNESTNHKVVKWQKRLMTMPPALLRSLGDTDLRPRLLDSVSVLVICVSSIGRLLRQSTPEELMDLVTDVQQGVTTLLDSRYHEVLQVEGGGQQYTLVVGLAKRSADHLKTAACLALDLLTMSASFSIRHSRKERLSLRIGLGTGRVVMGLTGTDITRLSLFGEAMVRAQSMCDTSLPSAIQLNDATHTVLATLKYFTCVESKHSKDKSTGKTYWLVSRRDMAETFNPEIVTSAF